MKSIDACGRSCPEPVLMTKKALEESSDGVTVTVDNAVAVENVSRFAGNKGYIVKKSENGSVFTLEITRA